MINFQRVVDDVTLDCDESEPKTVFRIRSLNYDDETWLAEQLRQLGDFPLHAQSRLLARWAKDGVDAVLDQAEETAFAECSRFWGERDRLRCARGVIEIDRKSVTPEQVLQMFGDLPPILRATVQTELASKIAALGQPAPKSQQPSGSPLGSGRTGTTPAGAVSSASSVLR